MARSVRFDSRIGRFRTGLIVRLLIAVLSSLSILSLLLYFTGINVFQRAAVGLLSIELFACGLIYLAVTKSNAKQAVNFFVPGLWAGALATLAYDIVRIPVAHSGIPVFKAISYFGTVLLGVQSPTPLSETVGWAYHLSNGVSFGLMYAALVSKPRLYSAVIWGLMLEAVMLMTPYAEVFGYRRDAKFFAITIGAHAIYGAVLYVTLRWWTTTGNSRLTRTHVAAGLLCVPLGLFLIASDSYRRYSASLPLSPPAYIGPHLYTTWDVAEPDRIVAMWITQRFVDSQATFYFIKPFDTLRYGRPFDVPEAEIRRHGIRSATQFLLDERGLNPDVKLNTLARMTYLNEVTPWMLASDAEAGQLTQRLRLAADKHCGQNLNTNCVERLFSELDDIYRER